MLCSQASIQPPPSCQGPGAGLKPGECRYPHGPSHTSRGTLSLFPTPAQACSKQQVTGAHSEKVEPIGYHGFCSLQGGEKRGRETGCGKKMAGISERKQTHQTPQPDPGSTINHKIGVCSQEALAAAPGLQEVTGMIGDPVRPGKSQNSKRAAVLCLLPRSTCGVSSVYVVSSQGHLGR